MLLIFIIKDEYKFSSFNISFIVQIIISLNCTMRDVILSHPYPLEVSGATIESNNSSSICFKLFFDFNPFLQNSTNS